MSWPPTGYCIPFGCSDIRYSQTPNTNSLKIMLFAKTKTIPLDRYTVSTDFDADGALGFSRDKAPAAFLSVMLNIQDRIADAATLVAAMATAKEPGYLAHAAGQLNALQELWDDIESRRADASRLE